MATNNVTNTSKPVTVAQGGTGVSTLTTPYGVLCAGTTATDNVQTLASLGSSTQVLTSNGAGALPSFQAAAGASGGLTFIATATASNSATIDFAGNLTSTYDNYMVVIEDLIPATDGVHLSVQVGTGGGPTYQTSSYACSVGTIKAVTSVTVDTDTANAPLQGISSTVYASSFANDGGSAVVYITNANNASDYKWIMGSCAYCAYNSGSHTAFNSFAYGRWQSATVLTSLRFLFNSGNIASGTFKLYGFKN